MTAVKEFLHILKENKSGKKVGIYSICSSHPEVIKAGMIQATDDNSILCIESTSNQVDQFGGYTGMTPDMFITYVKGLAEELAFPTDKLLFGGDHLGPNAWQNLTAAEAMMNAKDLISAYVKAGYLKIHLDTSMFCLDDQGDRQNPLSDKVVALRASELCMVAEKTWKKYMEGPSQLHYIIGTEVPVPGGTDGAENEVTATKALDAQSTFAITKKAFIKLGLNEAWKRVVALVVQPGVEFGDENIFQYNREAAKDLSNSIQDFGILIFEAHSTDYQSKENLTHLVEDHFCILKVGPWLTFAYREALFALEEIERKIIDPKKNQLSCFQEVLEKVMIEQPKYWKKYYSGDETEQLFKRCYSFSDRSRYYLNDNRINDSIEKLKVNLNSKGIPLSILSQYMPSQFTAILKGAISNSVDEIIHSKIRDVLKMYSSACGYQ
ncbi:MULTISPECIES: class II D-tagatose-bisphosphate aldolase, non-catalytic subunit [unclassified Oceanispirochaeta]|uniref:class II D-tagatose-bisphosphate aldolase, non-catalytic subunit n=1 Tax=unclassified Oceanispirochaeta TaxID=2635722 RepID=UPI000E094541|nr:class II D-tagatose-bisphosphate aldolase, non-catalytic subunit [Oceanispirochaeta sp. M1]MBF9014636.1 class II D-tagatose-bisphosphate aldolase, non-catalytic subunit [Oceanispirochaeta sp. M2]NPD70892.1 class II D-tagatose-bisphosphate aldolase, non-catalytic subunit [Oceanispirochaeta sp. M1]RDG34172.1 tagatose-bisphosphate aldolase [Oceanispirochaeta sp. M1]